MGYEKPKREQIDAANKRIDDAMNVKRYVYTDQPVRMAEDNRVRFVPNRIVRWLLDQVPDAMNTIQQDAQFGGKYTKEEQQQLAQLIGYSLSGYAELSYVTDAAYARAHKAADKMKANKPAEKGGGEEAKL